MWPVSTLSFWGAQGFRWTRWEEGRQILSEDSDLEGRGPPVTLGATAGSEQEPDSVGGGAFGA